MKKLLSMMLVAAMLFTMTSFTVSAAAKNPKRVKIFTMGDSFTAGVNSPNAYRYFIYENLVRDGGVFEFIGPKTSGDFRVTDMYRKHGGVGAATIGCADDFEWNGQTWVNKSWNVETLIKACRDYIKATGRRISFEYALIDGVNDSKECAEELARKLKGIMCHVNLIPANEVPEKGHKRSDDNNINNFKNILEKNGLTVTVRRTLGSDINASCGQLRREKILESR